MSKNTDPHATKTSWKKHSTKQILSHPRVNVFEDQVELPNGHVTDYVHFGNDHDAACIIAINADGQILLQREYNYPSDEWLYQFPGGKIEDGEEPLKGAIRELAEEANVAGTLEAIGWFYTNNRRSTAKMYVFVARDLSETFAEKDMEESFETFWFDADQVRDMISSGAIINGTTLASWALFLSSDKMPKSID